MDKHYRIPLTGPQIEQKLMEQSVPLQQGADNAGKMLAVDADGKVVPVSASETIEKHIPDSIARKAEVVTSVNGQTGDVQTRLIVTLTANEDGTYTSSHTPQEIYAATQEGAVVEASDANGRRYSLYTCNELGTQFLTMGVRGSSGKRILYTESFVISSNRVGKSTTETPIPVVPVQMVGATDTAAGSAGLVPAPTVGDNDKFLRGDGTWGEIDIPEDGGGDSWRLVSRIILTEDATSIQITEDSDGNAFALKKFHIVCCLRGATGNTGSGYLFVQTMSNLSGVKDRILALPSAVPASGAKKTCYCNAELCGESLAIRGASAIDGTSETTTYSFTLANTAHFQRASMLYNPISDLTISASNSGYGAGTMIDLWGVDA